MHYPGPQPYSTSYPTYIPLCRQHVRFQHALSISLKKNNRQKTTRWRSEPGQCENATHTNMHICESDLLSINIYRLKLELSPENASGECRPPINPEKSTLSLLTCLDCWTCRGTAEIGCCAPGWPCVAANGFIWPVVWPAGAGAATWAVGGCGCCGCCGCWGASCGWL